MALAQPHARIDQRVGDVGQDQPQDVQHRTEEHHGAHDGEVLRVDRVDGVTAKAGNSEERLHDEAAGEQQRDHDHDAGQDWNHGVLEHVTEQHAQFRQALGARGANVILADLLEKKRAVQARARTDAAHDPDQYRQHQELDRIHADVITRDRHQAQQHADQVLPADDVKQRGDGHHDDAQHHARGVEIAPA